MTDYFIAADQKIPEQLVKNIFLGEIETAIRLGITPLFGDLTYTTPFWDHGFLFNSFYVQVFAYSLVIKKLLSICPATLQSSFWIFTFAQTSPNCNNICFRKK